MEKKAAKAIGLSILLLLLAGHVCAGRIGSRESQSGMKRFEQQKFNDIFAEQNRVAESRAPGYSGSSDDPNEDEDFIGKDPVGDIPGLFLALAGLTYGIYLFKKRQEKLQKR